MKNSVYRKFAQVLLEAALNFQCDGTLILRAAPGDYLLAREVATAAYQMGAKFVHTEFADTASDAIRCLYASDVYLDYYPEWIIGYQARCAADNIAVLALRSPDPFGCGGLDDDRLLRIRKAKRRAQNAFDEARADGHVNLAVTCVPSVPWARAVYPELDDATALARLWEDFIKIVRLDTPDPVEAWRLHKEALRERKRALDALRIETLYFSGPGTALEVGLIPNALWTGGYDVNPVSGLEFIPNIPTEELFAVPDKRRVNGTVRATLPLSYNGSLIPAFSLTILQGRVTAHAAGEGDRALRDILDTDEGSRYFGEIALVPVTSPIYQTGRVFYDTLLDENAVCHMALGNAPTPRGKDGKPMGKAEQEAVGVNCSQVHVDFMIGSEETDVDAQLGDGRRMALMRKGLWVL